MGRRREGLADEERLIVAAVYTPLRRFAAVVGPREVDPDDLVQEAFLKVLRRHRLTDLDHPLAYLRQTILNIASNQRRRFSRGNRVLGRLGVDQADDPTYPSDLADLFALSHEARAVVYLADVEGYSYRDIALMVGCSEVSARKRASRARRHLRDIITQEARS